MAVDVGKDPFAGPPEGEFYTVQRAQFDGREFTREADGRWFDERRAELVVEDGRPTIKRPLIEPYVRHSLARWHGQEIPSRRWFMDEWIPIGQVVSLYGRPGSRKSTLLLQWMIAATLGRGFGPCEHLAYGPAYGLFCEDSANEIARRALAILTQYGASFRDMRDCHAESLVDAHLTEFVTFRRSGLMETTPAWDKFIADIDDIRPVFVCLDVAADFFGGDEVRRRESSAFLRLLDKTASEKHFALVFSAHPSLRGLKDRSLMSGNTGWEGKVRARITLEDPTDEDEETDKPLHNQSDQRTLTLAKANYGKAGAAIDLIVRDGFFLPADLDPKAASLKGISREIAARSKFIELLDAVTTPDRWVHDSPSNKTRYAPKVFATHPDRGSFTERDFAKAMKYLLDTKRIRLASFTQGGRQYKKLENTYPDPNQHED